MSDYLLPAPMENMLDLGNNAIEHHLRGNELRSYYHANREPKVYLDFHSYIYQGLLLSYWESGVEIKIIKNLPIISESDDNHTLWKLIE